MKKQHIQKLAIVFVCILCFGMGLGVSKIANTESSNSSEWDKLKTVYSILTTKWYYANQIDDLDSELVEQAILGMTTLEEDAHTNYMTLKNAEAFSSTLEGSSIGIGFSYYLNEDGNMTISSVFINSPADQAGLQKGDIVLSVGDLSCIEDGCEEIISLIQSSEGKDLEICFIRDEKEVHTSVSPSSYDSTVTLQLEDDYAIIELNSFSEYSAVEFNEALQRMKETGISNLILDLRDNGGGYLSSVSDIGACLLPTGSTIFIENLADGSSKEQKVSNTYSQTELDSIVILQNEDTASASEVLIGALKDYLGDKVTTVGQTTYGKGTEQTSIAFNDGTSMKYTIAEWLTPNGTSINLEGFKPDIEVEECDVQTVLYREMDDDETIGEDTVHDNASALQTYLQFLGYDVDRTDDYFSTTSSNALKEYQKDHDLEQTGICDKETFEQISEDALLKLNKEYDSLDYQMLKGIEVLQSNL